MPPTSASDRKHISLLHSAASGSGAPRNNRDASNPAGWSKPPTSIAPGSTRGTGLQATPGSNPYTRGNMKNTLNTPKNGVPICGNPQRQKTVLARTSQTSDPRAPKRQKLDLVETIASGSRLSNPPRPAQPDGVNATPAKRSRAAYNSDSEIQETSRPKVSKNPPRQSHPSTSAEILVIQDSDEDTGVHVSRPRSPSSPDPMLLTPNEHQSTEIHDFQTKPFKMQPRKKAKAREVISPLPGHDGVEDISSFSGDESLRPPNLKGSTQLPICNGHVDKVRREFEERVRHVDFRNPPGVSKRMKPKHDAKPPSKVSQQLDKIATSESGFETFNSQALTKDGRIRLPLKAWYFGLKLLSTEDGSDPGLFLEYIPGSKPAITITSQHPSYTVICRVDREAESALLTNNNYEPLRDPIVIQLRKTRCGGKNYNRIHEGSYKPGSKQLEGYLTFLFSMSEPDGWTITSYQQLVSRLSNDFKGCHETVIPSGASRVWEVIQDAAELVELKEARSKKAVDESAPPSMKSISPTQEAPAEPKKARTRAQQQALPEMVAGPSEPRRRSTRNSAAQTNRPSPSVEPDELILVYPPTGTGALNIMRTDVNRLQPGEFLNDTLIEFGLKLWLNELREKDPVFADQIHVFSSFFYKKLHNKKSPEDGYQSVKKWTSKFDLFSKKYIIVPINENLHWYLVIIYEPEHILSSPLPHKSLSSVSTRGKRRQKQIEETPNGDPPGGRALEPPPDDDVDAVSLDTVPPSTSSLPRGEVMEDLFDHSCSISDGGKPNSTSSGKLTSAISDKPTSASSSRKPASAASSKTADRGRSVSISLEYPSGPSSPPRVDDDIMDVDPPASSAVSEEVEVTDGISSSKNDALFAPNGQLDLSRSGSGVPTATFYGSTYNKKGKRKAVETLTISDSEDMADDRKQEEEVDDMLAVTEVGHSDSSVTHIFTLDSLGAKHPQAIRILRNYLKMEAKDKKGIEPENTREAAGRQALVPAQPNFCDCGVYLLHFAKTFMTDPLRFYTTINSKKSSLHSERKVEWNEEAIPLFRQDLIGRIEELSATWKAERAAKEELKKKKAAAGDDVGKGQEEADSSEGEVDIVEDLVQEVPVKPSPRAKAKPVSKAAARLRG